jgi:hypothetical protein
LVASNDGLPKSPQALNLYDPENYNMGHKKRGIALLININKFEDEKIPVRYGSEEDMRSLQHIFGKILGFQVLPREDLKMQAIIDELEKGLR